MANVKIRLEAIIPDEGLDFPTKRFERYRATALATMAGKTGPEIKKELRKFTQGWDTKVDFVALRRVTRDEIGVTVFPRGSGRQTWLWVSEGTDPHPIPSSPMTGSSRMRFFPNYSPHTSPGGGFGGSGSYSGDIVTARWIPMHPGIEARNFEVTVKDEYEPTFERDMEAVAAKAYV